MLGPIKTIFHQTKTISMRGYLSSPRSGGRILNTNQFFKLETMELQRPSVIYAPVAPLRCGSPPGTAHLSNSGRSALSPRGTSLSQHVWAVKFEEWMVYPLWNAFNWCTFDSCATRSGRNHSFLTQRSIEWPLQRKRCCVMWSSPMSKSGQVVGVEGSRRFRKVFRALQ